MNNYALPPRARSAPAGDVVGMGEHTDFGIVTVLWADQVAGLQVLGSDGTWHDVVPADGALLVNLGDLTARLHQRPLDVDAAPREAAGRRTAPIERRRSAAFFHDGNADSVVAPLAGCVAEDDDVYEPIVVRDHIAAKLSGSRQGRKNTAAVREAARVLAADG